MKITRRFTFTYLTFTTIVLTCFLYVVSKYKEVISKEFLVTLASLNSCPVCYGYSACTELQSISNLANLTWENSQPTKSYLGSGITRSGTQVVIKQLVSYQEQEVLDGNLCKEFYFKNDCKSTDALIEDYLLYKIKTITSPDFTRPVVKGIVLCPNSSTIFEFIKPFVGKERIKRLYDLLSVWTMLSLSPEPILLQIMSKDDGWPVPNYLGTCGRLEVVTYEGIPISSLGHLNWYRKLKLAKGIITGALDFTYKHDKYRFYLMDWSMDNIVANDQDVITFVDLEDVVIIDKHNSIPYWDAQNGIRVDSLSPNVRDTCYNQLSDHNIWEACNILAAGENPLLYPIPGHISPHMKKQLHELLQSCLSIESDRFRTILRLQHHINIILANVTTIND